MRVPHFEHKQNVCSVLVIYVVFFFLILIKSGIMCLSLNKPHVTKRQSVHSIGDSPRTVTFRRLPEIVVFLSTFGSHLASAACYFFEYRYFADKWNYPFEYKNRRQTCGARHLNKTQLRLESQVSGVILSRHAIDSTFCTKYTWS